ncbi:hypothetical protein TMatcc_008112 [Talaromyces marneffei ATCC 18224]
MFYCGRNSNITPNTKHLRPDRQQSNLLQPESSLRLRYSFVTCLLRSWFVSRAPSSRDHVQQNVDKEAVRSYHESIDISLVQQR